MDIVIDCRMIRHSGIGVYLKNIVEFIDGSYNVTLLGDPAILKYEFKNIQVIPFYADIYSVREQFEYRRVIPACDIFWSPHYNVPIFLIKAKKRVVTIHDVYHLANFDALSFPKKVYSKFIMGAATKMSDKIITVSDFSKNEIIKYTGSPSEKIKIIHNGVGSFKPPGDFAFVKDKYQLPDDYFLFVGNVKPHKNLKKVLQAYLLLPASLRTKYKIVIVGKKEGFITGDHELFEWISAVSDLAENTLFTGFVDEDDLNIIYANAAVFIFPSLYEGFGLPPLEAMKNSCVTMVSDIPGVKEVCGNASLYFDPLNEQDISSKMAQLLNDTKLRHELISAGLLRVTLFKWASSGAKHIQLFNEVTSSN